MTMVSDEARRGDEDLASLRARAVTIVTTTSGLVTLLTGLTTFAASTADEQAGVPTSATVWLALALGAFVLAAATALVANLPGTIEQASAQDLRERVTPTTWFELDQTGNPDTPDQERVAAGLIVTYLVSVRRLATRVARLLTLATGFLVVAIACTAVAAVLTMRSLS